MEVQPLNRQRYLAELQRLLGVMTEEDRQTAVQHYAALFDAAGEDGEAALAESLGSPTRAAVALTHGYKPGVLTGLPPIETVIPEVEPEPEPQPATVPEEPPSVVVPAVPASDNVRMPLWDGLPEYVLPTLPGEEKRPAPAPVIPAYAPASGAAMASGGAAAGSGAKAASGAAAPAVALAEPEPESDTPPLTRRERREAAERHARGAKRVRVERTMPLGLGIVLFVFIILALGLPLAVVFLTISAAALVPGAGVLTGAYLLAVGGLWSVAFMADACILFGCAAIVLAVGLVVFCAGLWLAVTLITLYVRFVRWLAGELLGRRVTYA